MYTPIKDYGIIGNIRSAALVSKQASVDWAPAPFIDSPSVFGRILDDEKGGYWQICPASNQYSSKQYYIPETNILVTEFHTSAGILTITDFIPIEHDKAFMPAESDTTYKIHRKVSCISGSCDVYMECVPKFDYARGVTHISAIDGGAYFEKEYMHGVLASEVPIDVHDGYVTSQCTLSENESQYFIFRYNAGSIEFHEEDFEHHEKELEQTAQYWIDWSKLCERDDCPEPSPWHSSVIRSALLLKILFFEPIGTVAAAPTTSLPEEIGGVRNWDYRYTWLRDSSFIFEAFFNIGHVSEAQAYIKWLINQCYASVGSRSVSDLQIMYGLRGEQVLEESELTHLKGYEQSQPVRIGNAAYTQKQWDVYGSVFNVVWHLYTLTGVPVQSLEWQALTSMADRVCDIWREPDEGLWEVRGGARHFVYSKVMCWVALDRAIKLAETHNFDGDITRWISEREVLYADILDRGWSDDIQSFVQSYDSNELDTSLLLLPVVGFIDGQDERMLQTIAAIEDQLVINDCFLKRYSSADGLPGDEGAFMLASFWYIDALAMAGKERRATELFEKILTCANHVGLFAEEINPYDGTFLGNFPQAYTHIGLINSAIRLSRASSQ